MRRFSRFLLPSLTAALGLAGCGHFSPSRSSEHVYVMAKDTFLRDRVAAVSNKVATVNNGERLTVVDHGRRFVKVQTERGAVGWLEEHMVIDQATYDKFKALEDAHQKDAAITTAVLRDDLYAHLLPGRDSAKFLLLPENDKLQLIQRASVPKPDAQAAWMRPAPKAGLKPGTKAGSDTPKPGAPGQAVMVKPAPKTANAKASGRKGRHAKKDTWLAQFLDPNAPPMEDWWLVRDGAGRVGWVLARRLDVDVPEEVIQYSEGQRLVGAYLLNKVSDPDSKFPGGQAPNYLAVLEPYKDGLPYDFDQIRVYAWNVKKHRYEGAYRKRDIAGYFPVTVTQKVEEATGEYAGVAVPVFTVKVATEDAVPSLDTATGLVRPVKTEGQTFSLEGELVKRLADPNAPVVAKPAPAAVPAASTAVKRGVRREAHKRRKRR